MAWERFRLATIHGNVVLNFTSYPKGELAIYGHAYHEAADRLAKTLAEQNGYSDVDACPIVFLYRHSIELYLKAIILWGTAAIQLEAGDKIDTDGYLQTHRFRDLLPMVKRIFEKVGWLNVDRHDIKFGTFEEIEELILKFEEIDQKSFAFRYPVDTKGYAHLPKHFHFNVIALAEETSAMLGMLDGAATGVYEIFQSMASAAHEAESYGYYGY